MELMKKIIGPLGFALILVGGVMYGIFYTSGGLAILPLLLGLLLTVASVAMNLRSSRSEASRRSTRYGLNAGASIVFLAAILIFLQTFSSRHSARIDTTENRRFSLYMLMRIFKPEPSRLDILPVFWPMPVFHTVPEQPDII